MAALIWCIFRKNQFASHQLVLKFLLSWAIALRNFNRFRITLGIWIPNSELKYEDRVNTIVFKLREIKRRAFLFLLFFLFFFWGGDTRYTARSWGHQLKLINSVTSCHGHLG